jgi:hypothetical protein
VSYPQVLGELETLRLVAAGKSLARFGDGEFNHCLGGRSKQQRADPFLNHRLREILGDSGECLVGIPNIHSETPKAEFWSKYRGFPHLCDRAYVSAFVTRPDSAPWLDTPEYWTLVESLWLGRDVTLVSGSATGLRADELIGAASVRVIPAPEQDAWNDIDRLKSKLFFCTDRVLLCLGPTATVLAVELAARGTHAIDIGHIGRFLRRHRAGTDVTSPAKDAA